MNSFGRREVILALFIFLLTGGIISYKVYALGYSMTSVDPESGYFVRLVMSISGNGNDCDVHLTLPIQSDRQVIKHEKQDAEAFKFTISPGRIGRWSADNLEGEQTITYSCLAQTQSHTYPLPEAQDIPTTYSIKYQDELEATDEIQKDHPEIQEKAWSLAPKEADIKAVLRAAYNYAYKDVRYLNVRGPTDALTAMRLGEASCNGKNRLMVAVLRARGIPARMVNGLILDKGRKRTTHAWTEAWIQDSDGSGGDWIPFCPTNGYFATIPEKYLELAKGDVAILTHTKHIGFDWEWTIRQQLKTREEAVLSNTDDPLNILHAWTSLKDYQVSLGLIMVILMVPIGATIVAFSRNVIGLLPFGTFMPALIAVAFRETGFLLGTAMFVTVILIGAGLNSFLLKLRLLHIPRLVIIITVVVMSLLGLSIILIRAGYGRGAAVSLFPMAIVSLTCERFTLTIMEDGIKAALQRMVETFVVAGACFAVMSWNWLQFRLAAYPELLLANIGVNLILGSWTGLRLLEYSRFRHVKIEA